MINNMGENNMLINYYTKYQLDEGLTTKEIREELEDKCADTIRRLNNAGGNAKREYELRKALEVLEEGLDYFDNDENRRKYDDKLRQGKKAGMLTNEDIGKEEIIEGQDQGLSAVDDERLEKLLEKIVARQQEKPKEKEASSNRKVSTGNVNKDKANSITKLAIMEMETDIDGYIWRAQDEKIESYIDDSLRLDSENYLTWYAKFINSISFQGGSFRVPWDFTKLSKKELNGLSEDEINCIKNEIKLAEALRISNDNINKSIVEWQRTPVSIRKKQRDNISNIKEQFSDEIISNCQQEMMGAISQAKEAKKDRKLIKVFDKIYETYRSHSFSQEEKIRKMSSNSQQAKDMEVYYNRAINLAPMEEKRNIRASMDEHIDRIYYWLLKDGYARKKQVLDKHIDSRYDEIAGLEDEVESGFHKLRKRVKNISNPVIDKFCYMLMALMALFMLTCFTPLDMEMTSKYIIMLIGYLATYILITKLRGPFKYQDIIINISIIPIILFTINLYSKNIYLTYLSMETIMIVRVIFTIIIGKTLLTAIKEKDLGFILRGIMANFMLIGIPSIALFFVMSIFGKTFSDTWKTLFMIACLGVPSYFIVYRDDKNYNYKFKALPDIALWTGIRDYGGENSNNDVFTGGKLFEI